jgi:TfoX/Sxy family transcriptional regulator of competence genes
VAYDQRTVERIREIFRGHDNVVEKRMVGGLSFIVNGSMCCGVTRNDLMIRVGPENRERVLARPHVRPMKIGGKTLAGFILVEPDGYRTAAALRSWVERGIKYIARSEQPGVKRDALR